MNEKIIAMIYYVEKESSFVIQNSIQKTINII